MRVHCNAACYYSMIGYQGRTTTPESNVHLNTSIDRNSYVPLYAQVQEAIRDAIQQGEALPGDQLPSEPDLCQLFDVSRTVVRQALVSMEYEGLIVRRKGKGTFVARPKIGESLFQELTGFYQDMESKGERPVSRVLQQQVVPATAKVAEMLALPVETPVLVIDRVRSINNEPLVLVTTWLPYALCPNVLTADLTRQSLYALLERDYGIVIARGKRMIQAIAASEYEAGLLEIARGAPLVALESISYLEDGTPVEYYKALHRGDRSMFEVELVRSRDKGPAYVLNSNMK